MEIAEAMATVFTIPWAISAAGERASTMGKAISVAGEKASTMRGDITALGATAFMIRKGIWSIPIEKPICGRDLSKLFRSSASCGSRHSGRSDAKRILMPEKVRGVVMDRSGGWHY